MASVPSDSRFLDPETLAYVRGLFPYLPGGRIYLNHAATGPLSSRVIAAMNEHLASRSTGAIDDYWNSLEKVALAKKYAAGLVNAESPDRIALTNNTSDALNIVASGLPWQPGDRIILNDQEFPANVYPFLNLRRLGVEIDFVKSIDGKILPQQISDAISDRTRLVSISAVQFLSGFRADLGAIGELCRSRGIIFVSDAIQAVGAIPVDVQAMKIDALAAGAQKWQMSPHGTGFLYIAEDLQARISQQNLGWLGVDDPWKFFDYDQPLAASARRYEGGTLNLPGVWGMQASLATFAEIGMDRIAPHVLALSNMLAEGLQQIGGIRLFSPAEQEYRAGIVSIELTDGLDAEKFFKELSARNIAVSLREGKIRFSPHYYNSREEIETALSASREITQELMK